MIDSFMVYKRTVSVGPNSTPKRIAGHLAFTLLAGCAADPNYQPPPITPDAGLEPERDVVGAPLSLFVEPVVSRPTARAWELGDGNLLATGAQGLTLVDTGTVVSLGESIGDVLDVADLPGGTLIAGTRALSILAGGSLADSPLLDALPGLPTTLLSVPGREGLEVWLAGPRWIRLWRAGEVYTVKPGDLPVAHAKLAFGAAAGGQSAVWVASEGSLYAVVFEAGATRAFPENLEAPVVDLAVDARRTLWVVDQQGNLRSRRADDVWRDHDAVTEVTAVFARPSSNEVWIETMTGLWRYDQSELRKVQGSLQGAALCSASLGSVLIGGDDGLHRGFGERQVRIVGMRDGDLLAVGTTLSIQPIDAAQVTAVTATLDGVAIAVSPRPFSITLDPALIEDGTHKIEVTATYAGGTTAQGSLRFSHFEGPPPSWDGTIAPLYTDRCAVCHGPNGVARRLDSPALWTQQIDAILLNVRTRRMPLPPSLPLTDSEIGLIEGWRAAGFPIPGE
jgi:hypothetical protein